MVIDDLLLVRNGGEMVGYRLPRVAGWARVRFPIVGTDSPKAGPGSSEESDPEERGGE